jgi:NAD(P)-dependent dehydrogenase (short-subunit alcohol dehydrogenase family)
MGSANGRKAIYFTGAASGIGWETAAYVLKREDGR